MERQSQKYSESEKERERELIEMQRRAIDIARAVSGNYEKIILGDKRCERAMQFVLENEGKILTYDAVLPELMSLDAGNRVTASKDSGIEAVEAALHSLHDPVLGLRKALMYDERESGYDEGESEE